MESEMKIRFWGTRGLISAPNISHRKYGGNTTCIQIKYKEHLIILDTGFGVSNLGEHLMKSWSPGSTPLEIHILFSHFHWDHIQGLPFFHPIYFPKNKLNLYSPFDAKYMHSNLDFLFDGSYSPFAGINSMPSTINFISITDKLTIDEMEVTFCETNHGRRASEPDFKDPSCFAYKFTLNNKSATIATDHEASDEELNQPFIQFAKNSDVLVHDAQFTQKEYSSHVGWGHSSVNQAMMNAKNSNVGTCILTHHDPRRSDNDIERIYNELNNNESSSPRFYFAQEEVDYTVG